MFLVSFILIPIYISHFVFEVTLDKLSFYPNTDILFENEVAENDLRPEGYIIHQMGILFSSNHREK